jgi:hypothetical protein
MRWHSSLIVLPGLGPFCYQGPGQNTEAGVLKTLSLAGLVELTGVRNIWFGLALDGYRGLGVHDSRWAEPANL